MDYEKQKEKLLKQLKKVSGLTLEISGSELSEEDTIEKIKGMLTYFNSSDNKQSFLQSFFNEQLKTEQIFNGLNSFNITDNAIRVPFLLESKQEYSQEAISIIKALFSDDDLLVEISPTRILFIKEYENEPKADDIRQQAQEMIAMLDAEVYMVFNVAWDESCNTFTGLLTLYKNVCMAMTIGEIFASGNRLFSYQDMDLGRLLYGISESDARAFFGKRMNPEVFQTLDEEILHILDTFFENDLSIAETARQLFLHRNTLIYKLDKFQVLTGLDVRKFKDAATCKVALMLAELLRRA